MIPGKIPDSIDATHALLKKGRYAPDRNLATMLYLSLKLGRPLLLEGPSGVGKSELGMVLARQLGRPLLRLQCYEGLDSAAAVYEWNYAAQMIEIRLAEQKMTHDRDGLAEGLFSERFLIKRPILQALEAKGDAAPVLLIDEIDRADAGFEAHLLEILSDFQVSVPELGAIRAEARPIVVLTSNRTREIHDALKRRCIYHWLEYPDAAREAEILRLRAPGIARRLTESLDALVQKHRQRGFRGAHAKDETDWTATLLELDREELDPKNTSAGVAHILRRQQQAGGENAVADALAKAMGDAEGE